MADNDLFLDAMRGCIAALSHGSPDRSKWQHDAREAVQRLATALDAAQSGGAVLEGVAGPWESHFAMVSFIRGELSHTYLRDPDQITRLPVPRSWLRRMEDFIEDCGGARSDNPAADNGLSHIEKWSTPQSPAEWSKIFKICERTFVRWYKRKPQPFPIIRLSAKSYQVAVKNIPTLSRR